jgi:hypothetical protein
MGQLVFIGALVAILVYGSWRGARGAFSRSYKDIFAGIACAAVLVIVGLMAKHDHDTAKKPSTDIDRYDYIVALVGAPLAIGAMVLGRRRKRT